MSSISLLLTSDLAEAEAVIKPLPGCSIIPALSWSQAGNGEMGATDRGYLEDIYDTDVTFFGTLSEMNTLGNFLFQYGRLPFYVTVSSGLIFAPNINQASAIQVVIPVIDRVMQVFFSPPSDGVQELRVTFRALSPTRLTSPAASLSGLILQESFEADKSTEVSNIFTYDQSLSVLDRKNDFGRFKGRFRQDFNGTAAAIRYFMETARGSVVAFPTLPGVTYPFGVSMGALPLASKVHSFSITRPDLDNYDLDVEWVQSFESV